MANPVLILYAHPSPNRSKVNRYLFQAATALDFIRGHDLYDLYPHMHVDVAAEQQALRQHGAVVLQFPLYWYSAPSLMKEWIDTVLTSGFSHGGGEQALAGKKFMVAVTTGGGFNAYADGAVHGALLSTYLAPFEQTARFCGMHIELPFIVQGAGDIAASAVNEITEQYKSRLAGLGE